MFTAPEMIPTFLLVDPEMIPKQLENGDLKNMELWIAQLLD